MTKLEAYQLALDFFVKRNHSTSGQIITNFSMSDVFEMAEYLMKWSNKVDNAQQQ